MYQKEIALGASDSIAYMNRTTRHQLACVVNESFWHETIKSVQEAVTWADYCEQHSINDCYVTDNSFQTWRGFSNVREITRLAVDLDYYNTPYADLDAMELWESIAQALRWVPAPTIIEDSGRGAYFKWKLRRPLPINAKTRRFGFVGQWQICQDFLTAQLKPWGADPKASDVTRVLRLAGTINSKNLARAQAWTCGPEYEFAAIKAVLNAEHVRQRPQPPDKTQGQRRTAGATIEKLHTWHSLAWARLTDLETLADLRGGRFADHRRRALFVYAVEACHYCRSVERLEAELSRFIATRLEDPHHYQLDSKKTHIKAILKRFQAQEERGHWEWHTDSQQNRYRLRTSTIIQDLNITPSEQRQMRALVGKDEKYRRKVCKRRKNGVEERQQYLARGQGKKALARKMKASGLSTKEIAQELGVSVRTIRYYNA